jgi:hypothetical protein
MRKADVILDIHRNRRDTVTGVTNWRAGCAKRRKSGSEGGGWKRAAIGQYLAGRLPCVRRVTTRLIPVIHGRDRVREGCPALYALGCRTHLDGKPEGENSMSEKAGYGEAVKP